jgi:hypothetical protein
MNAYDPYFSRTLAELQRLILYTPRTRLTQDSQAETMTNNLVSLVGDLYPADTPFESLRFARDAGTLELILSQTSGSLTKTYPSTVNDLLALTEDDLRNMPLDDLIDSVKGLGPKTGRYFVSYSRPAQEMAVIDCHDLRLMLEEGLIGEHEQDVSSKKRYRTIEERYVQWARRLGLWPWALHEVTWRMGRGDLPFENGRALVRMLTEGGPELFSERFGIVEDPVWETNGIVTHSWAA